jgi:hypothetical protein
VRLGELNGKKREVRGMTLGVRCGVSIGVEDGCRPPALEAGHPRNGCKAASGVAHPQSIEGTGMAGQGETFMVHGYPLPYACGDD